MEQFSVENEREIPTKIKTTYEDMLKRLDLSRYKGNRFNNKKDTLIDL